MDTIEISDKTEAPTALRANFPDAPTEVITAMNDFADEINQTRGGTEWSSDYLNVRVVLAQ
jgi:hypothetical protein